MIFFTSALLLTILHAYLDAQKIKKHELIDHFWRSVVWFFACIVPMGITEAVTNPIWYYPFMGLGVMISIRIAFFDYALNKFRGLHFSYISLSTNSFIDTFYRNNGINQNYIRIVFVIVSICELAYLIINNIY